MKLQITVVDLKEQSLIHFFLGLQERSLGPKKIQGIMSIMIVIDRY